MNLKRIRFLDQKLASYAVEYLNRRHKDIDLSSLSIVLKFLNESTETSKTMSVLDWSKLEAQFTKTLKSDPK